MEFHFFYTVLLFLLTKFINSQNNFINSDNYWNNYQQNGTNGIREMKLQTGRSKNIDKMNDFWIDGRLCGLRTSGWKQTGFPDDTADQSYDTVLHIDGPKSIRQCKRSDKKVRFDANIVFEHVEAEHVYTNGDVSIDGQDKSKFCEILVSLKSTLTQIPVRIEEFVLTNMMTGRILCTVHFIRPFKRGYLERTIRLYLKYLGPKHYAVLVEAIWADLVTSTQLPFVISGTINNCHAFFKSEVNEFVLILDIVRMTKFHVLVWSSDSTEMVIVQERFQDLNAIDGFGVLMVTQTSKGGHSYGINTVVVSIWNWSTTKNYFIKKQTLKQPFPLVKATFVPTTTLNLVVSSGKNQETALVTIYQLMDLEERFSLRSSTIERIDYSTMVGHRHKLKTGSESFLLFLTTKGYLVIIFIGRNHGDSPIVGRNIFISTSATKLFLLQFMDNLLIAILDKDLIRFYDYQGLSKVDKMTMNCPSGLHGLHSFTDNVHETIIIQMRGDDECDFGTVSFYKRPNLDLFENCDDDLGSVVGGKSEHDSFDHKNSIPCVYDENDQGVTVYPSHLKLDDEDVEFDVTSTSIPSDDLDADLGVNENVSTVIDHGDSLDEQDITISTMDTVIIDDDFDQSMSTVSTSMFRKPLPISFMSTMESVEVGGQESGDEISTPLSTADKLNNDDDDDDDDNDRWSVSTIRDVEERSPDLIMFPVTTDIVLEDIKQPEVVFTSLSTETSLNIDDGRERYFEMLSTIVIDTLVEEAEGIKISTLPAMISREDTEDIFHSTQSPLTLIERDDFLIDLSTVDSDTYIADHQFNDLHKSTPLISDESESEPEPEPELLKDSSTSNVLFDEEDLLHHKISEVSTIVVIAEEDLIKFEFSSEPSLYIDNEDIVGFSTIVHPSADEVEELMTLSTTMSNVIKGKPDGHFGSIGGSTILSVSDPLFIQREFEFSTVDEKSEDIDQFTSERTLDMIDELVFDLPSTIKSVEVEAPDVIFERSTIADVVQKSFHAMALSTEVSEEEDKFSDIEASTILGEGEGYDDVERQFDRFSTVTGVGHLEDSIYEVSSTPSEMSLEDEDEYPELSTVAELKLESLDDDDDDDGRGGHSTPFEDPIYKQHDSEARLSTSGIELLKVDDFEMIRVSTSIILEDDLEDIDGHSTESELFHHYEDSVEMSTIRVGNFDDDEQDVISTIHPKKIEEVPEEWMALSTETFVEQDDVEILLEVSTSGILDGHKDEEFIEEVSTSDVKIIEKDDFIGDISTTYMKIDGRFVDIPEMSTIGFDNIYIADDNVRASTMRSEKRMKDWKAMDISTMTFEQMFDQDDDHFMGTSTISSGDLEELGFADASTPYDDTIVGMDKVIDVSTVVNGEKVHNDEETVFTSTEFNLLPEEHVIDVQLSSMGYEDIMEMTDKSDQVNYNEVITKVVGNHSQNDSTEIESESEVESEVEVEVGGLVPISIHDSIKTDDSNCDEADDGVTIEPKVQEYNLPIVDDDVSSKDCDETQTDSILTMATDDDQQMDVIVSTTDLSWTTIESQDQDVIVDEIEEHSTIVASTTEFDDESQYKCNT